MPSPKAAGYFYLRVDLKPKLEARHKKSLERSPDTNPDLGGYINDLLALMLKREEDARKYSPDLELDDYTGNMLVIKNKETGKKAEIYRHADRIGCATDDSFDCEHVRFALDLPEIAKLRLKRP
jgi:hypothetical protein